MNVMITINSMYFRPTMTMLTSLFEHNDECINVYLLYNKLEIEEIRLIKKHVEKYRGNLYPIQINIEEFQGFPLSHHFSLEVYYKFLVQDILPSSVDRVLYLDVDMIINKSIKGLYYQNFDNNYIVVCEDINKSPEWLLKKLKLPLNSKYFNTGVMLFNLKLIRKEIRPNIYFDYIKEHKENLTWLDQDVLNVIFNAKSKYVDNKKFNMQVFSDTMLDDNILEEILNNTSIIHYIGAGKPWDYWYNNKLYKEYWKYSVKSNGYISYFKYLFLRLYYNFKKRMFLIKKSILSK